MHQNMARGLKFRTLEVEELHTVYVAKTKALISFADRTVKLICAYVLAYTKSRFSHAAQLSIILLANLLHCGSFNAHK